MVSGMHSCISDDVTLRAICAGSLWQFSPPFEKDPKYIESAVTKTLKTTTTRRNVTIGSMGAVPVYVFMS